MKTVFECLFVCLFWVFQEYKSTKKYGVSMIPNAYKPQTISLNRLFVLLRRVVWLKNITAKVFFYKDLLFYLQIFQGYGH